MSYEHALKAAGAAVIDFEYFGEYSGQWFAKVSYNGETGWIQDWFGSCSHCDAFDAEFDFSEPDETDEVYNQRLAEFGRRYLGAILPAQHFLPELDEKAEWDGDAADAAVWIRKVEGMK